MATDKYVSVRILKRQYDVYAKVAELCYSSVNKLVQQASDNWIEDESQVWIDKANEARRQLKRKL